MLLRDMRPALIGEPNGNTGLGRDNVGQALISSAASVAHLKMRTVRLNVTEGAQKYNFPQNDPLLPHHQAAIHVDDRAGNVTGFFRGQKRYGCSHFFGPAETPHGSLAHPFLLASCHTLKE